MTGRARAADDCRREGRSGPRPQTGLQSTWLRAWARDTAPETRPLEKSWALKYAGLIIVVGATIGILVTVATLTVLPGWWGSDRIEDDSDDPLGVSEAKVTAESEIRNDGLKVAAGVAAITAGLVAYGRLQLSRAQHNKDIEGLRSERYTRAVEQLGSDRIEVRLGGVYALEQLYAAAEDRQRDTITEVLSAFVRANSPPQKPLPDVPLGRRPAPLPVDLQGAITVLGRLDRRADMRRPDLSGVNLSVEGRYRAALTGALMGTNLVRADLGGAEIAGANLTDADLTVADLSGARGATANLTRANLTGAILKEAELTDAKLNGADLRFADLSRASLESAVLSPDEDGNGTAFTGANLTGADLAAADLTDAVLDGANLAGVLWNSEARGWKRTTQWPHGFRPPTLPSNGRIRVARSARRATARSEAPVPGSDECAPRVSNPEPAD